MFLIIKLFLNDVSINMLFINSHYVFDRVTFIYHEALIQIKRGII
jgi:hypothetical protein